MKRKISLIVIGLAIVLIPTFIMLSFYITNRNVPVEIRKTEEIVMVTPDGKTVKASADGKNKELLDLLCDLTIGSKSVEKLPPEFGRDQLYEVTFHAEKTKLQYRFYFSENPAYCYYVIPDGACYRIETTKAESFLNGEYAEPIYAFAKAPTVTVNGQKMSAGYLNWEYRLLNGTYRKSSCSLPETKTTPLPLGALTDAIEFNCTPTPDTVVWKAYTTAGTLVYEGDQAGLAQLGVDRDTELRIELALEWKKDAAGASPFCGKAVYHLKGNLYPPAAFEISKTEIRAGDVFILQGINVNDPDSIAVTIEPKVDFTPVFVRDGKDVKALMTLGFPTNYLEDTAYTITVSASNLPKDTSFTVTVKGGEYGIFTDYVKKDVLNDLYTVQCKEEFLDQMREIMAQPSTYQKEEGSISFGEGVKMADSSRYYHYGTKVTIYENKSEYRALDTMYCTYSASRPIAVADGKVLYVGETALLGKMVVIDHGQGIRSWYCNLGEITVEAGDILQKGDELGKCLGGGFNGQGGLNMHVALTLENMAIDLKTAIENGIVY